MSERTSTVASNGMVATPHALASASGLDVLREGGNALDAAIAANAVLTVVYPDQTSIGGDCFVLYWDAAAGRLHGLNGSGRAPARADRQALRAAGHTAMPQRGIHAVTVPGTVDAWAMANERFGRFGLDRLLAPAIGFARDGFPLARRVRDRLAEAATTGWPGEDALSAAVYATRDATLRLPALAESLALLARDGRDAFYTGRLAERLVRTSERLGGWLSGDDLTAHRGAWVEPLTTDYRGLTVAEVPPNSQGLTTLLALNLVEQEVLPPVWGSTEHLHPLIEATKLALAVRDTRLADPDFEAIDAAHLTSKAFARDLWRAFDPRRARNADATRAGDTVYLCAVDRDGNAASVIQSLYMRFGSGIVADGTGILLHNRGAYFSLDDDHPNRLEPGKRPLHTLMPAMLFRDGALVGPLGTHGGDAQAQVQLQLVTDLVDFGMDPQAAIDAPRWVVGGEEGDPPTTVTLEAPFLAATFEGLAAIGHHPRSTTAWAIESGHAQMILRDDASGLWRGGADPRADGAALGY